MEEINWLPAAEDCELLVRTWNKEMEEAKAVILISHGMTEHTGRYRGIAQHLNKERFIVYADDHRGHGKTGEKQGHLGFIAEKNGSRLLVDDMHMLINHIKLEHPGLPIFIYGHSMGSFIARNYIQEHANDVDGVVLSGSGTFPERSTKLGLELASRQSPRKKSELMNELVFGGYNNRIVDRLTIFDWLSRDRAVVESYMLDPLSGYVPSAGFFVDLLSLILSMQEEENNKHIRTDLPLLFLSGDADPVGNYSKGVFQAAESYTEAGLQNVLVALYPEARHELHNEINKHEVFMFLTDWLNRQLT